jgi:glutamine cyclotransferase
MRSYRILPLLFTTILLLPVSVTTLQSQSSDTAPNDDLSVELLVPEVLSVRPHNTDEWTQGLVWDDGRLFQSTGEFGQSRVQELDPQTGEVLRVYDLPDELYGEGLALVDDQLVQITWQQQVAIYYDLETFEPQQVAQYIGEGWGLCYDGEHLYMSDGSQILYQRDPQTFQVTDAHEVTLLGVPIVKLNELECVEDDVYANVWETDRIVRIDKATGEVNALIDASNLLSPEERAQMSNGAVLNGIAYNPDDDTFLLTGKLWPSMFEVRFVPGEA